MLNAERKKGLQVFAEQIRLETLKVIKSRGFGHVGGSMSLVDVMAVLYGECMNIDPKNPKFEDRDRIVMSKGHAGPVMYATLGLKGYYPIEEAYTLNQPHTKFPSHTDRLMTPGVDITTGSLGQGVSAAVGVALANKVVDGRKNKVFLFVGDGEADEGQVWEGLQFASQYKLDNLIVFIDCNGLQLDGTVEEIMSHGDMATKVQAYGYSVQSVNGHDVEAIYDAVEGAKITKGQPSCIILNTIKGKGATFAEPTGAHTSQPTAEQWEEAIAVAEKRYNDAKNA
ncbi:MAG: transketolase [Bacteroidaceae bacterium]